MKTVDTMIYRERDREYIFSVIDQQDWAWIMEIMQDAFGPILQTDPDFERLQYSFEDVFYMNYDKCEQVNVSDENPDVITQSNINAEKSISLMYMSLHLFRVVWKLNDNFITNYSAHLNQMDVWERGLHRIARSIIRKKPSLMSCASYYYRDAELHLFDRVPDCVDCELIDKVAIVPKQMYGIFPGNTGWIDEKAYIFFDTGLIFYLNEWNIFLIFIYRMVHYAPAGFYKHFKNEVRSLMHFIYISINKDQIPAFSEHFIFGVPDALAIHNMNVQQIQFIMAHEYTHLNNRDSVTSLETELLTDKMAYEWTKLNVGRTDVMKEPKIDILELPYITSLEEYQIDAIKSLFLFYKYYHICNDLTGSENYKSVNARLQQFDVFPDSELIKFIKEYLKKTVDENEGDLSNE